MWNFLLWHSNGGWYGGEYLHSSQRLIHDNYPALQCMIVVYVHVENNRQLLLKDTFLRQLNLICGNYLSWTIFILLVSLWEFSLSIVVSTLASWLWNPQFPLFPWNKTYQKLINCPDIHYKIRLNNWQILMSKIIHPLCKTWHGGVGEWVFVRSIHIYCKLSFPGTAK